MKKLSFIISIFLLSSCAVINPYTQFYKSSTNDIFPPTEVVEVIEVAAQQFENVYHQLLTNNYQEIGRSNFNGGLYDSSFAKQHAKSVGAEKVLIVQNYTETTAYTSGFVTYGYGVAPITSSQRRFDQTAAYFVKRTKKLKFGVFLNPLTQQEMRENSVNHGLKVLVVINESPMFKSGIIPGDIILEINGKKIINNLDIKSNDNKSLFKILRGGKIINVEIITQDEV
tara:strand:- start:61 stop:741 length:681 start_codon:yes stop_codon:yes gene_type:complete